MMRMQRNIATMKKASTFILVLLGWLMVSSQALDKDPEVKESEELGRDTKRQNETESLSSVKKFSMIVVLKDFRSLMTVKTMCTRSKLMWYFLSRRAGLPDECHMPNMCRRLYSTALYGFAGEFTDNEMYKLQGCLPGAVYYKELDGEVTKMEDVSLSHWVNGSAPVGNELSDDRRRRLRENVEKGSGNSSNAGIETVNVIKSDRVIGTEGIRRFDIVNKTIGSSDAFKIDIKSITGVAGASGFTEPGLKVQTLPEEGIIWHLDRVEKRNLPLNGQYRFGDDTSPGTGTGVTIYVIDSGIKKNHQEFAYGDGSPGSRASYGYDFLKDSKEADDCDGHGTHVASTAAGLQVGYAKNAEIVALRILDCVGSGTISDTVAALDWVAANAKKPAIVILSLGIQVGSWSRVLEEATKSLVVNHGITVVVASGNSAMDACYIAPGNVPEVITVAASDVQEKYGETKADEMEGMYRWSNTGPCIDLFAPGVDIFAACGSYSRCDEVTPYAYTYASGTSMAVPSVAGVAALFLETHPEASPDEVYEAIINAATLGKIDATQFREGTANRLLYSWVNENNDDVLAANGP